MKLGYCRVSTEKTEQDTSVKAQLDQLKAVGCTRIVQERRSAYKAAKRPGWESCKEMIASGLVAEFVVVSLSRASRRQETGQMSELCNQHSVTFTALTGGSVDVSTPEGLLNVGIQDTINRFDSKLKSVRIRQGQAARRANGATAVGRCPFGYRYNGTRPEPDPKQFKAARQLWDRLAKEEFRANKVLRNFPTYEFSNVGLIRWMKNPMLMGRPTYADIAVKPLVSPEEFARCQRFLDSRSFCHSRAPKKIRLLSSMVECQGCGRFLTYNKGGNKWRMKCMNPKCKHYGRGLAEFRVRDQLIEALRENAQKVIQQAEKAPTPVVELTPEQLQASQQLEMLLTLQSQGMDVTNQIKEVKAKLASPVVAEIPVDWSGIAPALLEPGLIEAWTDAELRPVLLELVDKVLYVGNPAAVEIRFR